MGKSDVEQTPQQWSLLSAGSGLKLPDWQQSLMSVCECVCLCVIVRVCTLRSAGMHFLIVGLNVCPCAIWLVMAMKRIVTVDHLLGVRP